MKRNFKNSNKGFTLVELIVSIAIFMIIMLAAMGSLFVSLDALRKVRAQQIAIDSVNYAVESMTRSIRLGTNYYSCNSGCENESEISSVKDGDGDEISFIPQNYEDNGGKRITYKLNDDKDSLERCIDGNCSSIVSPDVTITKLKFDVQGADESIYYHPRVYIQVGGEVVVRGEEKTSFAIQTIASQRNLK